MTDLPRLSIVVCTRNHKDWLCACLDSIFQDTSLCSREIIVVDNGSTDGTAAAVADLGERGDHPVALVSEPRAGQSRARNTGVRASAGELVAFTDDDVAVADGWSDALVGAFTPGVAGVGGRILADFLSPPPAWMNGDLLGSAALVDHGPDAFEMDFERVPVGANMAFRRGVLNEVDGPVDERLGHIGRAAMGYEELHLCRFLMRHHRIVYEPTAIVSHRVRGDRLTYSGVRRQCFQRGFGMARHERLAGAVLPTYPRRVVRAVRTGRTAIGATLGNLRRDELTAAEAEREMFAFMGAGAQIETLTGRYPRVANWIAEKCP